MQVLLLGEEERGQKPYQILCFVNHIHANEFISPDAMEKLRQVIESCIYFNLCFIRTIQISRITFDNMLPILKLFQKNPSTIRVAEDNKGVFNITIDMKIKLKDSIYISRHIGSLCSEAPDTTFTSKVDIDKWAAVPGNYYTQFNNY